MRTETATASVYPSSSSSSSEPLSDHIRFLTRHTNQPRGKEEGEEEETVSLPLRPYQDVGEQRGGGGGTPLSALYSND